MNKAEKARKDFARGVFFTALNFSGLAFCAAHDYPFAAIPFAFLGIICAFDAFRDLKCEMHYREQAEKQQETAFPASSKHLPRRAGASTKSTKKS